MPGSADPAVPGGEVLVLAVVVGIGEGKTHAFQWLPDGVDLTALGLGHARVLQCEARALKRDGLQILGIGAVQGHVHPQGLLRKFRFHADLEGFRGLGVKRHRQDGGDAVGVDATRLVAGGRIQHDVISGEPAQFHGAGELVIVDGLVDIRARRQWREQPETPARGNKVEYSGGVLREHVHHILVLLGPAAPGGQDEVVAQVVVELAEQGPGGMVLAGDIAGPGAGGKGDRGDTDETAGIGAFAMAAAPAIVTFIGGAPEEAVHATLEMYEIAVAEHQHFTIPALGFRGSPVGIDIRKVVELGVTPRVNTGIAHREAGVGQVGAGLVRPPMAIFEEALVAFADKYLDTEES